MKIDRVIFCLNNNPLYRDFWNVFSKVWKEKYKINPTLMFVGTDDELKKNNLSKQWGEIYRLNPVSECIVDKQQDWSTTWALFYGASLFKNDVCLTMGIDQIPLSHNVFDMLKKSKKVDNDKYVILLSSAYKKYGMKHYPSGWHIAKGKKYSQILKIDKNWETEVKKVFSCRNDYKDLPRNFWALDEYHSSYLIDKHISSTKTKDVAFYNTFFEKYWQPRRLCRSGSLKYDKQKLLDGKYTELHAPRPFEKHSEFITKLIDDLLN